jgi:hypothetical protein
VNPHIFLVVAIVVLAGDAVAATIPLPRPRPAEAPQTAEQPAETVEPSACQLRVSGQLAVITPLPAVIGPGECGGSDLVRLEAVLLADKRAVPMNPPATLRCLMAEGIAQWVREDVTRLVAPLGVLAGIENYDSYDCRGRNRVVGAKVSEHGRGNALDVKSIKLASGKAVQLTEPTVPHEFRDAMRASACARFTTVLGPGSDGYHEEHVHVDLAQRRGGYKMCQWDVRDPPPPPAAGDVVAAIPLPRPRPATAP